MISAAALQPFADIWSLFLTMAMLDPELRLDNDI